MSDRFSDYNPIRLEKRQLCGARLIRDPTTIGERPGASAEFGEELLYLQQQLFGHWHHYNEGLIDWLVLQQNGLPIRQTFEATLQRVVELGYKRGERTPGASKVRTRQQLLKVTGASLIFLENRWF